eukprot:COSAG02_NODE_20431_length_832_cov_1.124147_2_plen_99_part_00
MVTHTNIHIVTYKYTRSLAAFRREPDRHEDRNLAGCEGHVGRVREVVDRSVAAAGDLVGATLLADAPRVEVDALRRPHLGGACRWRTHAEWSFGQRGG